MVCLVTRRIPLRALGDEKGVTRSGDWIPRDTLIAANAFSGVSWIALLALTGYGVEPGSLPSLAYVHIVALGWLSLTALSVLIHVTPAFLGVVWRLEPLARFALRGFAIAVAVLVAGLGTLFGLALNGRVNPGILRSLPPAHALLGIAGWLTLLVFGVSTRTMRAINAVGSRWPASHIIASSMVLLGAATFALGAILSAPWLFACAGAALTLGVMLYTANLVDILRRNAVPNRIPQAFVAAALVWLLCALGFGLGVMTGRPWGAAFVYVALVGWLGQMINAHVFHIGIRLLITSVRGDEDETRPWTILNQPLAGGVWIAFQIAVALGSFGLATHLRSAVEFAAIAGLIGWFGSIVTIVAAYRRLRATGPEATLAG